MAHKPETPSAPTPSKGISREELVKKLAADPRFVEAKKSGQGYVILGARPFAKPPA